MTYPDNPYLTIHAALVQWLEDWSECPVGDDGSFLIAHQNQKFSPPADAVWIRLSFEPNEGERTLGGSRITKMRGLFRLTVMGAKGNGSGPVEKTADSVMRRFKVAAGPISHEGSIVRIASVWREAGITLRNAFMVPVVVRWWAFTDKL